MTQLSNKKFTQFLIYVCEFNACLPLSSIIVPACVLLAECPKHLQVVPLFYTLLPFCLFPLSSFRMWRVNIFDRFLRPGVFLLNFVFFYYFPILNINPSSPFLSLSCPQPSPQITPQSLRGGRASLGASTFLSLDTGERGLVLPQVGMLDFDLWFPQQLCLTFYL